MDEISVLSTQILFGKDARHKLFEGLEIAAHAVGCTLGPKGKTVIISRVGSQPLVTKDGVTVSKAISFKDPMKRMGAELIKESASQTNDTAGDGTTTATILTHALVKEGMRLLDAGYDASALKIGMSMAVEKILTHLKTNAKILTTLGEIAQVATVSANGDLLIGDLIAEAMNKVGNEGIVTVEDAKGTSTTLDVVEGMQLDRGYLSPYFVNNTEKMHVLYNDVKVLVTDKKLSSMKDLIPILEKIIQSKTSLLIVAEDIEGEALQGLVVNRVQGNLPVVAIKSPGYGLSRDAMLADICALTGAKLVSSKAGLPIEKTTLQDLGSLKKVMIDSKRTTLVGEGKTNDVLNKHITDLKAQSEDITISTDEIQMLRLRIARLSGGVAIIKVGGSTEIEMIERKHRIEDALNATRAAVEEGIVPGGGTALYNAMVATQKLIDGRVTDVGVLGGIHSVLKAVRAPFDKIISNAGKSPEVVSDTIDRNGLGYNAATDSYVDLVANGIIDPVKVTRTALENAISVANVFLSLDAAVIED